MKEMYYLVAIRVLPSYCKLNLGIVRYIKVTMEISCNTKATPEVSKVEGYICKFVGVAAVSAEMIVRGETLNQLFQIKGRHTKLEALQSDCRSAISPTKIISSTKVISQRSKTLISRVISHYTI